MKGVVLAGGTGSRLNPITRVTNKHLLPVFDKPMVYYPIQTLVNAGIEEILLVTGGKNAGDFFKRVVGIEEKPKAPKSKYAVIGIYLYDETVFEKIRCLKPSGRGELEITDVNNLYIQEDKLSYEILDGWWTDAGTFDSLLRANNLVAKTGANKMSHGNRTDISDRQAVGQ